MCYVNDMSDLVYRFVHFVRRIFLKHECVLIPEMGMRNLKLDETHMLLSHCVILMSVAFPLATRLYLTMYDSHRASKTFYNHLLTWLLCANFFIIYTIYHCK